MATKKNWIQGAIKRPGAFTAKAKKDNEIVIKLLKNIVLCFKLTFDTRSCDAIYEEALHREE